MTARKTAARRVTAALAAAAVAFSGAVLLAPSASADATAGTAAWTATSGNESQTTPFGGPVVSFSGVTAVDADTITLTLSNTAVAFTGATATGGVTVQSVSGQTLTLDVPTAGLTTAAFTVTPTITTGAVATDTPVNLTVASGAFSLASAALYFTVNDVVAPAGSWTVVPEDGVEALAYNSSSVSASNVILTPENPLAAGNTINVSLTNGAKFAALPAVRIGSTTVTSSNRSLNSARTVLSITVPSGVSGTLPVTLSSVTVNTTDLAAGATAQISVVGIGSNTTETTVNYFTVGRASVALSAVTVDSTSATSAVPTFSSTGNITVTVPTAITTPSNIVLTFTHTGSAADRKVDVVGTTSSVTIRGTGSSVFAPVANSVEWVSGALLADDSITLVNTGTGIAAGTYIIRGIQIAATPGSVRVDATVDGSTYTASNRITAATASSDRIAGADRYATSARIAVAYWATAGAGQDTVVIANGEQARGGADALAASYFAAQVDAPVVLVEQDYVPSSVLVALLAQSKTLLNDKFTTVYVLGDTNAVSAGAVDSLVSSGVVNAIDVERISGADRFATSAAVAVAGEVEGEVGSFETSASSGVQTTAFLANGWNSTDALVSGPIANAKDFPVLLTDGSTLSSAVSAAINNLDIERIIVLGDTNAVSAAVVTAVEALDVDVTRIGGATRFDTAASLNTLALTSESSYGIGLGASTVYLTDGFGFADALVVSPLAGLNEQLVATTWSSELAGATKTFLTTNASTVNTVTALGGTDRVSADVLTAALAAAR